MNYPPRRNKASGSGKPLPIFSSANQYITLLYVSFFLKTSYLIYSWSLTIELMINSCQNGAYPTHFLYEAHRSPGALRNARQHFSPIYRGHVKQCNCQQKAQKCERCCHWMDCKMDTYLQYESQRNSQRQSDVLYDTSWGKGTLIFPSAQVQDKSTWCGGLQINFSGRWIHTHAKSTNNEAQVFVCVFTLYIIYTYGSVWV